MDEKTKYLQLWNSLSKKTSDALNSGNDELADKLHQQMEDAYERYREAVNDEEATMSMNFSNLNSTFESVLPKLLVKDKKAVSDCIKLIKEDKNLSAQFKFCNALKKFNCDGDAKDYINESLKLVKSDINYKTLSESNRRFAKFLIKHNIKPLKELNEEEIKFNDSCDYLLTHKKNLTNLTEITNCVNNISNYIVEHKKENEKKIDVLAMAENVERKLNSLNEDERALVKDIMVAGNSVAEERRKNLFNKIKNECIEKINKMISENDGDEKERLLNLKETILLKEYDKANIVGDIAKLLEIGAVLSDNEHDKFL